MKEQMPSPEELKAIQKKHMTEGQIKMSEEREATIKAGSKIEREDLKQQMEFINNKLIQHGFDDNYMGIVIESNLEGRCIGTEAYAFIDDEGGLQICLKNNRTDKTTTFSINKIDSIGGLFADEEGIPKTKVFWKSQKK